MRDFVPMAVVGLLVANGAYALGVLPLISVVAGFLAAVAVSVVRDKRAKAQED